MKGTLAAMTILLITSGTAAGVEFRERMALHPPAARASALAEVMQERLALTPEQTSVVRSVAEKHAGETDEALTQLKRKQLRKRLKAIREARDAEFKGILSEDEYEAYLNDKPGIMRAMKARMRGEKPPTGDQPVPDSSPVRDST